MNLKKAKMIRQAMRAHGVDAKDTKYSAELPYISCWYVEHPLTKVRMRQTAKPLTLAEVSGRSQYQKIKKQYVGQKTYRTK